MKDECDKYFESKKIIIAAYTPAVFCAFISLMALLGPLVPPLLFDSEGISLEIPFYSFLPMCFMYGAFTMHALIRQVRKLQVIVDDLSNEKS